MRELVSDEIGWWHCPRIEAESAAVFHRAALRELRSGVPWELLPREVFGCSGMNAGGGCGTGTRLGVWDRLHRSCSNGWTGQ